MMAITGPQPWMPTVCVGHYHACINLMLTCIHDGHSLTVRSVEEAKGLEWQYKRHEFILFTHCLPRHAVLILYRLDLLEHTLGNCYVVLAVAAAVGRYTYIMYNQSGAQVALALPVFVGQCQGLSALGVRFIQHVMLVDCVRNIARLLFQGS